MKPRLTCPLSNGDAKRSIAQFGVSPRTEARPLLPPDPDEDVWLEARRRGPDGYRIGASELAAVLGVSPYASPFSLWWAKQSDWERSQATARQRYGHAVEDGTAELFGQDRPELLVVRSVAGLWGHPVHDWLVCTPDFIAVAAGRDDGTVSLELVEIKADKGSGWGKPGTDQVPAHYRIQLLVQCEIFGATRGWLVHEEKAYLVEYDQAARDEMAVWIAEGQAFVAQLEAGVSPPIDGHDATEDTLQLLHPAVDKDTCEVLPVDLIAEFEMAHTAADAAQGRLAEAKNRVRDRLGTAEFGVDLDGRKVVQRLTYKRRAYEVPAGEVDQLRRKTTVFGKAADQ